MKNHPPKRIKTPDGIVNILQLTDLHLCKDKKASTEDINVHDSFMNCLTQALAEDIRCDLIILTGDLVNELNTSIYDRIFSTLDDTNIPYICLSGNHDVTEEIYDSSSTQAAFISTLPDPRLISQYIIDAEDWQIILLDSSQPGRIDGVLSFKTLNWLTHVLQTSLNTPTLIVLHHHAVPVNSLWLDAFILANHNTFWEKIKPHSQVKAVLNGHVHQDFYCENNGVACYMTPSTCYQFKPKEDNFTYDSDAKAGYRWLQLKTNTTINSWVKRLSEY